MHEYRVRGLRFTTHEGSLFHLQSGKRVEKEWKGVERSGVLGDDVNKETIAPGTISG